MEIPLGYDSVLLDYANHQKYVQWDSEIHPHLLILGNTESGKTYFIKIILGRVSLYDHAKIWVCDYKNVDFQFLNNNKSRYLGYTNVIDGFNDFYSTFESRLNGNTDRRFCLLLIDEYISWLNSLEKKESEEIKKRMGTLLFMTRAFNMHIILGCQRAMAESFPFGSRDCLNVVFLGSPSKESVRSFCTSEEAETIQPCEQGKGYMLFDGKPPIAITVPAVQNEKALEQTIFNLMSNEE